MLASSCCGSHQFRDVACETCNFDCSTSVRGGENGGESLEIANWQSSPISTFGWHLTLSWVGDASLASWSSGGRSTVSPVGSTHSLWHSLKPSILQKLSFSFLRFGCRSADSCFSTRFTRPAGPSCWLVEHSRVAQLPLIGVQQLGKFASKFKAELHNDVVAA